MEGVMANKNLTYAIINGKILDGSENMEIQEKKVILVKDGKILQIVSDQEFSKIQQNAVRESERLNKIIDLNGKCIMPGLINMHVHLAGNGKPQKKQRDNAKVVKKILYTAFTRKVAFSLVKKFAQIELNSGVTTIRTVGGLADFDTRASDEFNSGKAIWSKSCRL